MAVVAVGAVALVADYDPIERYMAWSAAHEEYELDELLLLFFFTTIFAGIFSVRRMIELRRETARREASDAQARHLAYHDALTGLANRSRINERLQSALSRAGMDGSVAVLTIDLDRFKAVNDTLGHAAGDQLLCAVAERLLESIRPGDIAGRLGGDEFIVIQARGDQPLAATRLAERLVSTLGAPLSLFGHEAQCGASVGIALAPQDARGADALMRAADAALYQAKRDGRSTFRFFEPEMNDALNARRGMEQQLRKAVDGDGLLLHYQPLFDLRTKAKVGYEALLRWQHPERGLMAPADFIPLAEETGMIVPIGVWALHTACKEAASWSEPLKLALNLSPMQFRNSDIVETVRHALEVSGLAPERLELEITEGLLISDPERTIADLLELRALGVSIAMDDFGTGYSSLAYLWRFPFDRLKIDRSFVSGLQDNSKVAEIIQTIVSLGRTLSMSVTVEGIETADQMRSVIEQGGETGQGFLLGRPVPGDELAHRYASQAGTSAEQAQGRQSAAPRIDAESQST